MLSFVVLCDGPYHSDSFRPNEDERQWWGRRDALVRITHASCYASPGKSNEVTKDVVFVFHDTTKEDSQDNLKGIGIAVLSARDLCKEIPIPIESLIIRKFRNGFKDVSRYHCSRGEDIEIQRSSKDDDIICAEILPGTTFSALESSSSSTMAALPKKEMIKLLQTSCSIDFLRKHHLNGALELVAKKRNKSDVDAAYADYLTSASAGSASISGSDENSDLAALTTTFQSLLRRAIKDKGHNADKKRKWDKVDQSLETVGEKEGAEVIVLLLHEDYTDELPVFTKDILTNNSHQENLHVICVLGGVRDITNEETKAIFLACSNLNLACVGCNLGRTAEFTSKIITAMVFHGRSQALFSAVRKLPNLTSFKGLNKLPSIRKGHISWDGHKNTENEEKLEDETKEESGIVQLTHNFIVITKVAVTTQDINQSVQGGVIDVDVRMSLHGLIQLIISTLWRSRIGNHATDGSNDDQGNGTCVANTLYISFEDRVIIRIDESLIQQQIRDYHLSAPNEYQILQLLNRLLSHHLARLPQSSDTMRENEVLTLCLRHYYDSVRGKKLSERFDDVYLVQTNCCPRIGEIPSRNIINAQSSPESNDFLSTIYNDVCNCRESTKEIDEVKLTTIVVTLGLAQIEESCLSSLYPFKYSDNDHREKKKSSRLKKLKKHCKDLPSLLPSFSIISASLLITTFQHYAYHNRLIAGIKSLSCLFAQEDKEL